MNGGQPICVTAAKSGAGRKQDIDAIRERGMMKLKGRKWSHDWAHFNFDGVMLSEEREADGMSSLSWNDVKEYLVWLACNEPAKYGRLMMSMHKAAYGKSAGSLQKVH